ncbi:MAG: ATP-binding cassette domain-containing protein [Oxalobacter sp.]|nr:ATP-binding cassette domain-containing protein [Oxalobacter sp.]
MSGRILAGPLDFAVEAGDYMCIVGENGAGKSTLLKTLLGLIVPARGHILMHETLKEQGIGYLPQISAVQRDFPANVAEVVYSGCTTKHCFWPFLNAAMRQKAHDCMEKTGVLSLASQSFAALSGGQKQRVLLARALCVSQELLVLDEPTASLDPAGRAQFYALVENLNRQGTAVVMVTHDVYPIIHHARHVLHVGRPACYASADGYLESDLGRLFTYTRKDAYD